MSDHATINLSVQTLLDERHALNQHARRQPFGKGRWLGPFQGKRRGHGSEFDDLRHYYSGDDARHIDWKASARTNVLHTRLYREEREIRTTIVADLRDAMFTGSGELQAIRVCKLAARLIWQATSDGSRANVLVVTDAGISLSDPGSSHQAAIDACSLLARRFQPIQNRLDATVSSRRASLEQATKNATDAVIVLPSKPHNGHVATLHLDQVTQWMIEHPRKLSTVLWISAFQHCGNDFDQHLSLLCKALDNIAIVVEDPIARNGLPTGHYAYSIGYSSASANDHSSDSNSRSISLGVRSSAHLRASLKAAADDRAERFEKLMVPMLYLEKSMDELVSTLRHGQVLP